MHGFHEFPEPGAGIDELLFVLLRDPGELLGELGDLGRNAVAFLRGRILGQRQVLLREVLGFLNDSQGTALGAVQGCQHGDDEDADDHGERHPNTDLDDRNGLAVVDEGQRVLVQGVQHQLYADEQQDERQAPRQVNQAIQQPVHQEVELAQAHEGERGGREHDVRFLGEAEDRGDRVQGEEQVRTADRHHDQQHGGHGPLAVDPGEQLVPVVVLGGVEQLFGGAHHDVVGLVGLRFGDLVLDQLAGREKQEEAEDVEDERPPVDCCGTHEDERRTSDQREDDAEEQNLLLVRARHLERRHEDEEHEQVVHGQDPFGDVAAVVLGAQLGTVHNQDDQAEEQGHAHVGPGPDGRFLNRGLVGLTDVEDEVVGQQPQDHGERDPPLQRGNFHESALSSRDGGDRGSLHRSAPGRRTGNGGIGAVSDRLLCPE